MTCIYILESEIALMQNDEYLKKIKDQDVRLDRIPTLEAALASVAKKHETETHKHKVMHQNVRSIEVTIADI